MLKEFQNSSQLEWCRWSYICSKRDVSFSSCPSLLIWIVGKWCVLWRPAQEFLQPSQLNTKKRKSLLFTPLSHLCTQQHSQQPLSLTTYHRIISSICDSQHIIENHHVQNSTTTEDKDELLWFFSLFLGNKPRTDRKLLNKRALLIFANHFCCINIL